jgi:hypothetical protein
MKHEELYGQPVFHAEVWIMKQGNDYAPPRIDLKEQLHPQGDADAEIAKSVTQALQEIVDKLNSC